jgi:hypothetical protein
MFSFLITVVLERDEGKFASRDDLQAQVQEALENADEGTWYTENDSTYSTIDWSVEEQEQPKKRKGAA